MHDLTIQALMGALLAALLNMACAGADASTSDAPGEDATETNVTRPTLLPDEPASPGEPELASSEDDAAADGVSPEAIDGGAPARPQTE